MQVRDDPVTVIASEPHNVTEAQPWEGAVSVEHKSGDLLILFALRFLRTIGKLIDSPHQYTQRMVRRTLALVLIVVRSYRL